MSASLTDSRAEPFDDTGARSVETHANGADRLCETLLANGVDVCFANPGTSEMHFVAALDRRPQMRCVLGLFEGVATGAADGYGRMTGRPAATLLHTGPGLANGLANLHNARRAFTPIVNIVGDHAAYHLAYDAPLTSDIDSLARPMSAYLRRAVSAEDVGPSAAAVIHAARQAPGIATLVLPADSAWGAVAPAPPPHVPHEAPRAVEDGLIDAVVPLLSALGRRAGILLAGVSPTGPTLRLAGAVAAKTGAQLFSEVLLARSERGGERPALTRIPYPIDEARAALADLDLFIIIGGREPVAFFGYPGKPSRLLPEACRVVTLARPGEDAAAALRRLADRLGAEQPLPLPARQTVPPPTSGPLTDGAIAAIAAWFLPENAIVIDEGITSVRAFYALTTGGPPHDYLMCSGGAIGLGIPLAVGAATACPDRKVIDLQADGSAMYTVQGLWTAAREGLDILVVILSNRAYAILRAEMRNVGVTHFDRNAERMLRLDAPALDWVSIAAGMGVEAARAETAERFADLYRRAIARRGPFLIEAVMA